MFCSKCGKELGADASFCDKCGAKSGEKAASVTPQPPQPAEPPMAVQIIRALLQLLIGGLLLYWIWYSYGCAVGKYPNTGDVACRWFAQTFSVKNIKIDVINGRNGCIPTGCGSNWSSSCTGKCYETRDDCRRSGEACSGNVTCRQCP